MIILAVGSGNGQSNADNGQANPGNGQATSSPFTFRSGQSMYIVAFCTIHAPIVFDDVPIDRSREYASPDLDAERKIRKEIEEWNFFKVSDKPSQADFIFLVNRDGSSMEGLAIPYEAYRQYFKEKYDLDALRDAAFGRYLVGPLNIPTLSRLSDRLVKQFREKAGK
jgi:hypothetical protein